MQRLFSTFANGWPGAGILLQRGLAGSILLYCGIIQVSAKASGVSVVPQALGAIAGLLLLAGLWTPIAGAMALVVQVWVLLLGRPEPSLALVSGVLGMTIAMIGPGAWSIDARLFGRKHIEQPVISPKSSSPRLH